MTARDWLFIACEAGHALKPLGGANAGCAPDCHCSVPVNSCICGHCDYGQNEEADAIRAQCKAGWCMCGRPATDAEEPCCNYSGTCEAPKGAESITNCIHCGKELRERDGAWWTHDADQHQHPRPQGFVAYGPNDDTA